MEKLLSIQAGILRMPVLILKGSAASEPRSATTKAHAINAGAAVEAARQIVELESKRQQEIDLDQHDCRTREQLRCDKRFFNPLITRQMSKDMTDERQTLVTSQTKTTRDALRTKSKQTAEERWVQDALEHDDVRECLKLLHTRGKNESDSAA